MATKVKIYRGDTFSGTVKLREIDACDSTKQNNFPLPVGTDIEMRFPGEVSTVSLTTGASEITITDNDKGIFTYSGPTAKSLLLKLSTSDTDLQTLDIVVTDPSSNVTTFEKTKLLLIKDRAN